jgi:hypothetical protein
VPELPQPLPPEQRTIGQFIGETIRGYGNHFWPLLPLGLALGATDQACVGQPASWQVLIFLAAGPLFAAAFVWACSVVLDERPSWQALALALLIYLPFPVFRALYFLPGIAWFAFVGLAVPALMVERLPLRDAFRRGRELARADFVHAFGSLFALVVVLGIGEQTLTAALRSQSHNSQRAALFLADIVLSPMLFVGGALLYVDQAARAALRAPRPPADPALEQAAGGQSGREATEP